MIRTAYVSIEFQRKKIFPDFMRNCLSVLKCNNLDQLHHSYFSDKKIIISQSTWNLRYVCWNENDVAGRWIAIKTLRQGDYNAVYCIPLE